MQAAIATGPGRRSPARAVFERRVRDPTASLNNPPASAARRLLPAVDHDGSQRNDVLSVCPSVVSLPCPDGQSLLRANVIFYDSHHRLRV